MLENRRPLPVAAAFLLLLAATLAPRSAAAFSYEPMRAPELTLHAAAIVVATVEEAENGRHALKVSELLFGEGLAPGDRIKLSGRASRAAKGTRFRPALVWLMRSQQGGFGVMNYGSAFGSAAPEVRVAIARYLKIRAAPEQHLWTSKEDEVELLAHWVDHAFPRGAEPPKLPDEVLSFLHRTISRRDDMARLAARVLAPRADARSEKALTAALSHPDIRVQRDAAKALERIGAPQSSGGTKGKSTGP